MKRALISVFDKTGIAAFALVLKELGWEIISTGGTAASLKKIGIKVTDISEVTDFPECFDGRVKTLHPKIHGGILALRHNEKHEQEMLKLGIFPISMVVCNLYPFRQTLEKADVSHHEIVENIDIGGPTMLRAAAKNYEFVSVITDPSDYEPIINELRVKGETSSITKEYLACKVFQHTAHYDSLIAQYFNKITNFRFPDLLTLTFEKQQDLRYGENPHQRAAFYNEVLNLEGSLAKAVQLHGKELSYNNINDTNGAIEALKEFNEPTIVVVKHANPCAISSAATILQAFENAYLADSVSIFGGIIASNREIDEATALKINEIFVEVVISSSYSQKALEILTSKKNIRVLKLENIEKTEFSLPDMKKVLGGLLVQEPNNSLLTNDLMVVTKRAPTSDEYADLIFAWKVVKHTKSNGIVIAKNKTTAGIGPGQVSRIWALQNAARQAGETANGAVLASDAFFPFSDSLEAAAAAGITAVIQPGGSVKDADSIAVPDKYDIAMLFTGIRHFKH